MDKIFINNKDLINRLNQSAMAYIPALELDSEINLLSNVYYSTIMSILHFGEAELNFRRGERFKELKRAQTKSSQANIPIFVNRKK